MSVLQGSKLTATVTASWFLCLGETQRKHYHSIWDHGIPLEKEKSAFHSKYLHSHCIFTCISETGSWNDSACTEVCKQNLGCRAELSMRALITSASEEGKPSWCWGEIRYWTHLALFFRGEIWHLPRSQNETELEIAQQPTKLGKFINRWVDWHLVEFFLTASSLFPLYEYSQIKPGETCLGCLLFSLSNSKHWYLWQTDAVKVFFGSYQTLQEKPKIQQ